MRPLSLIEFLLSPGPGQPMDQNPMLGEGKGTIGESKELDFGLPPSIQPTGIGDNSFN
jgi:hypothetical protein